MVAPDYPGGMGAQTQFIFRFVVGYLFLDSWLRALEFHSDVIVPEAALRCTCKFLQGSEDLHPAAHQRDPQRLSASLGTLN